MSGIQFLVLILIVCAAVYFLRTQHGLWLRKAEQPSGRWEDCSECGGMGMVKFPERRPFDSWERRYWSLEQMKARGVTCLGCGGQERVFKPDD